MIPNPTLYRGSKSGETRFGDACRPVDRKVPVPERFGFNIWGNSIFMVGFRGITY